MVILGVCLYVGVFFGRVDAESFLARAAQLSTFLVDTVENAKCIEEMQGAMVKLRDNLPSLKSDYEKIQREIKESGRSPELSAEAKANLAKVKANAAKMKDPEFGDTVRHSMRQAWGDTGLTKEYLELVRFAGEFFDGIRF